MSTAPAYTAFSLHVEDDGVARVRLTQDARGNPFDQVFCDELSAIMNACDEDPAVRAVLITASGRFFSVGGDLQSLGRDQAALARFIKTGTTTLHAGVSRMARMDAPVIVAVHALAAGGGVSLSAAADFCIAARSAKFYAAYQGVGLAIDGGGSHSVPRRVGVRRATEFYLRNQTWSAELAAERGLISEVVDDDALEETALALARELAAGPTKSYGEVKNLLLSSYEQSLEGQMELEARAMYRTTQTADTWKAITAAATKRRPTFTGS
ncbi:Trans-2-decenoyl-[acyl-carrier-protein] isomerase [Paraconexibacter sp. AEG42_29]|uniref:Trans-2-decenoyl-[acyl-carrier-protein] isomerase n=1 Tax=Paraconexibacter sp. AEG42_29 TaxID=2997339 RepID=A0AAU7AQT9_9ACTN